MALYLRENLTFDHAKMVVESVKEGETLAYVYRWTHIPTGKWYVGSRTAKGCHPNDGYYCSSGEVKPLIQQNPSEWKREIIATGDPFAMLSYEIDYLKKADAKNDPMSFNRHNGDGKFTTLGRKEPEHMKQARIAKLKGIKKPENFGAKVSAVHKGKKVSDETKRLIGLASKGRVQSADARRKNSEKHAGDKNAAFAGYYISPTGIVYDSSIKAALAHNVTRQTIVTWSKNNKNGWKFQPKGGK